MKKLIHDVGLYGVVHFGSSLLAFVMLPIYTRYFSPGAFGTWDIFFTTMSLLVPFISCELSAATYRWLLDVRGGDADGVGAAGAAEFEDGSGHADNLGAAEGVKADFDDGEAARVGDGFDVASVIATGFFQVLRQIGLFTAGAIVVNLLVTFPFQWHALIVTDLLIVSGFLLQCARGLGRNRLFACLGLLQMIVVVIVNLVLIFVFSIGIVMFFYAYMIAGLIVIIVAWRQLGFQQFVRGRFFSRGLLGEYFAYALPIIPAAASWWVMTMSDRWMIAWFVGVEANGIYAIALKIPAILMIINTVFSLAWKDSAITAFHTTGRGAFFSVVLKHYFRLVAVTAIVLTLLARPLIEFFIGAAYEEAWQYAGILLTATAFHALGLFWSAGFHGAKQTKIIFTTSIIGAVLNVLINLIVMPIIGLYAAALSSFVAFFVVWVLRVVAARHVFPMKVAYGEIGIFLMVMAGVIWWQA